MNKQCMILGLFVIIVKKLMNRRQVPYDYEFKIILKEKFLSYDILKNFKIL